MLLKLINALFVATVVFTSSCATVNEKFPAEAKADQNTGVCNAAKQFSTEMIDGLASNLSKDMPDVNVIYKIEICRTLNDKKLGFAAVNVIVMNKDVVDGEIELALYMKNEAGKWQVVNTDSVYRQRYSEELSPQPQTKLSKGTEL